MSSLVYSTKNKTKQFSLGAKIKSGGEGIVYEVVGHPSKVAKIYLPNILSERKNLEDKILAMIKQPVKNAIDSLGHVFICWPEEALYDNSGFFCGFIMPKASSKTHLQFLYQSDSRKQKFPEFTWKVLLAVAYNLSHAVESVHTAGHIVGDFNPNNILIDKSGKVTLIDVDSFDITSASKRYPCEVGVEDYLAPELQGKNMKYSIFTKESDRFSLAIHVFQLLMDGNHPFHSVVKSNLNSKHTSPIAPHIASGECGYIKLSHNGDIPPGAPPYNMLPQKIRDLFYRVFNYSSAINSISKNRPSAYEWANALLDTYNNQGTKSCLKDRNHVYPTTLYSCPWCECERKKTIAHNTAVAQQSPQTASNPFYKPSPISNYQLPSSQSRVSSSTNPYKSNYLGNGLKFIGGLLAILAVGFIIVTIANNSCSSVIEDTPYSIPYDVPTATESDLTWTIENNYAIINSYIGYEKVIRLPSSIDGYPVKELGRHAFCHVFGTNVGQMYDMEYVILPEGIEKIGHSAFYGCDTLKAISIPSSVEIIDEKAFLSCSNLEYTGSLRNVKSIAWEAFGGCSKLREVEFGKLEVLSGEAFSGCENIQTLTIPGTLKSIGHNFFYGQWTFQSCTGLKSVVIQNGVEAIGTGAFAGCNNLEKIVIPPSVQDISYDAFGSEFGVYGFNKKMVIYCEPGSYAEKYAQTYDIAYSN